MSNKDHAVQSVLWTREGESLFWVKARDRINHNEQQAQTLALDYSYAAAGLKPFKNDQFQGYVSTIFAASQ